MITSESVCSSASVTTISQTIKLYDGAEAGWIRHNQITSSTFWDACKKRELGIMLLA